MDDKFYMNILTKLIRKSLTNAEPAKELVDQMFEDEDFKNRAIILCNSYLNGSIEAKLMAKSIDFRALSSLTKICDREKLGIIPLDFSGNEDAVYVEGDKINILFLSTQEKEINLAILEACSVSGTVDEILRKYADLFAYNMKDTNPMIEIKGVDKRTYEIMKKNIKKLQTPLRFTLFPELSYDGKYNVGFLCKTEPFEYKNGDKTEIKGPYLIPKIASAILASSLLENEEIEEEYEIEKKETEALTLAILNLYFESDEPFYLVQATVRNDGWLNTFMDKSIYIDFNSPTVPNNEIYNGLVEGKTSGLNHVLVPMTENEYNKYKSEVLINPNEISFFKGHQIPSYMPPETMKEKQMSESLIETLNRKREQILLMTDDFNGKNLTNLDNYIASTVHEIIMREDEDYSDWVEYEEIKDEKEEILISELENNYSLSTVYDSHDKLSELINAERHEINNLREENARTVEER